ncbi:MAG: dTDP-glucose 4,6-dehydratase [Simkaniaceae bacterium]|nr:dTDP-glucose 4,6-dehydratase [Simkaniaceae bacterium]
MKLLVTGGAGFMGSSFIRNVIDRVDLLVNLDALTYAGNLDNLKEVRASHYHFVEGDICDEPLLARLQVEYGFTHIVHFAAETHVDRSITGPKRFLETNVMGTYALLELVRANPGMKMHLISTDEVYGSVDEGFFTEETPYAPSSPYSASKAAADHLTLAYAKTYGIDVTISHASNNYGPCQYPEKLIPLMISKCAAGEPLPVYGDGTNVRDWLYVDDHSEAVWRILERGVSGEVYDISGREEVRNIDLVREIIRLMGSNSEIVFVKDRPGHDFRYAMRGEKMEKELGWKRRYSLQLGLERTIDWYVNEKNCLRDSRSTSVNAFS